MTQPLRKTGIIGLGRMGRAIAERLVEQGAELVAWNRTATSSADLSGMTLCSTPAQVAAEADIILVIVRDEAAMRDVYGGPDGLCSIHLDGKTVIEMGTASIQAVTDVLGLAAAAGAAVLDAPLSGSVLPARRGELLVMAGGEKAVLDAASEVLALIARRIVHVGPLGTGITMKLVVNLPLATYWQSLGEAIGLGLKSGLPLDQMLEIIGDSKAAIGALPGKVSRIRDAELPPEFDLAGMKKDLTAMCESAAALAHPTPVCDAALRSAAAAVGAGWGSRDNSQLARFAAEKASR